MTAIRGNGVRVFPHRLPLPTRPGFYQWNEWGVVVEVYKIGNTLWVRPPQGIPVKISPAIAGDFSPVGHAEIESRQPKPEQLDIYTKRVLLKP